MSTAHPGWKAPHPDLVAAFERYGAVDEWRDDRTGHAYRRDPARYEHGIGWRELATPARRRANRLRCSAAGAKVEPAAGAPIGPRS